LYVVTSRSSTFWQTLRLNDRRPLSLLQMPTTDHMVDNKGKRTRARESNRERKGERHDARTAKRRREGSRLEEESPEKGEQGERYPQNMQYYNTGLPNMKQHDTGHLHTPYTLFWSSVAPTENTFVAIILRYYVSIQGNTRMLHWIGSMHFCEQLSHWNTSNQKTRITRDAKHIQYATPSTYST